MVRVGCKEKKTRNPVTKGSNDWESSLWFYKNFDPSDKGGAGMAPFSSTSVFPSSFVGG